MESRLRIRREQPLFPERVRAGQRRMSAQRDLDGRREPAQRVAVLTRKQKRRLGEIHLHGHVLHPRILALAIEQTDRRRIALERLGSERVDLEKTHEKGMSVVGCQLSGSPRNIADNRQLTTENRDYIPVTFADFAYIQRVNPKPTTITPRRQRSRYCWPYIVG